MFGSSRKKLHTSLCPLRSYSASQWQYYMALSFVPMYRNIEPRTLLIICYAMYEGMACVCVYVYGDSFSGHTHSL